MQVNIPSSRKWLVFYSLVLVFIILCFTWNWWTARITFDLDSRHHSAVHDRSFSENLDDYDRQEEDWQRAENAAARKSHHAAPVASGTHHTQPDDSTTSNGLGGADNRVTINLNGVPAATPTNQSKSGSSPHQDNFLPSKVEMDQLSKSGLPQRSVVRTVNERATVVLPTADDCRIRMIDTEQTLDGSVKVYFNQTLVSGPNGSKKPVDHLTTVTIQNDGNDWVEIPFIIQKVN